MLHFNVYDDLGNEYYGGSSSIGNIFGTRHIIKIEKINETAAVLILDYDYYNRKMRFEIPLYGGYGGDSFE
ncbi:MAG TPA: hypothetical protein PK733_00180 [Clostridiales bacterium]|nr:hypothetical protein [Clostridiales bacterium]